MATKPSVTTVYHDALPIYHRSATIITYYLSGVTSSVDSRSKVPCDSMIWRPQ